MKKALCSLFVLMMTVVYLFGMFASAECDREQKESGSSGQRDDRILGVWKIVNITGNVYAYISERTLVLFYGGGIAFDGVYKAGSSSLAVKQVAGHYQMEELLDYSVKDTDHISFGGWDLERFTDLELFDVEYGMTDERLLGLWVDLYESYVCICKGYWVEIYEQDQLGLSPCGANGRALLVRTSEEYLSEYTFYDNDHLYIENTGTFERVSDPEKLAWAAGQLAEQPVSEADVPKCPNWIKELLNRPEPEVEPWFFQEEEDDQETDEQHDPDQDDPRLRGIWAPYDPELGMMRIDSEMSMNPPYSYPGYTVTGVTVYADDSTIWFEQKNDAQKIVSDEYYYTLLDEGWTLVLRRYGEEDLFCYTKQESETQQTRNGEEDLLYGAWVPDDRYLSVMRINGSMSANPPYTYSGATVTGAVVDTRASTITFERYDSQGTPQGDVYHYTLLDRGNTLVLQLEYQYYCHGETKKIILPEEKEPMYYYTRQEGGSQQVNDDGYTLDYSDGNPLYGAWKPDDPYLSIMRINGSMSANPPHSYSGSTVTGAVVDTAASTVTFERTNRYGEVITDVYHYILTDSGRTLILRLEGEDELYYYTRDGGTAQQIADGQDMTAGTNEQDDGSRISELTRVVGPYGKCLLVESCLIPDESTLQTLEWFIAPRMSSRGAVCIFTADLSDKEAIRSVAAQIQNEYCRNNPEWDIDYMFFYCIDENSRTIEVLFWIEGDERFYFLSDEISADPEVMAVLEYRRPIDTIYLGPICLLNEQMTWEDIEELNTDTMGSGPLFEDGYSSPFLP